jgi:hypothetical protein
MKPKDVEAAVIINSPNYSRVPQVFDLVRAHETNQSGQKGAINDPIGLESGPRKYQVEILMAPYVL